VIQILFWAELAITILMVGVVLASSGRSSP
jgi:hypothetical protein